MIELKKEFTKKGIVFKQIFRDDKLAIYSTSFPSYEVFKIIVHKPDRFHDDEYELYPYDEAFGVWAWSCSNEKVVNKVLKNHFPNHPMKEFIIK